MFDFAEKFPGDALDDRRAVELMSWLTKAGAITIEQIRGEVLSLHDPVLKKRRISGLLITNLKVLY